MESYLYLVPLAVFLMFKVKDLAAHSIRELMNRYRKEQDNPIAMELLGRYQAASQAEQGEIIWSLLKAHERDLSRIVARMGEDPEEELQNLYLKLHQLFMRGKFPESNWKYWLARIMRNDMLNKKTRKKPLVSLPMERLPEQEVEEPKAELPPERLQQAISQLCDSQRQVVELRYLKKEGKLMTYKEIAQAMNCTVGQVHGYLDRAKENLRHSLNGSI
ncbi:MAG: sigma-70 family RNA polymerase sigma factor [Bacteroidota bacterium]